MRNKDVVSDNKVLAGRVAFSGFRTVAGTTRGEGADIVAEDGGAPGLVEGDPVLHLGQVLEADFGVVFEIFDELFLVEEAEVALVKGLREIPMEEGDEGGDAVVEELIHVFLVEFDALGVEGIVAAAERDDAGPGDGEAVGFGTIGFEECNVFFDAVVGVAGGETGRTIGDLAGDGGEGVPNGGATAVFIGGAFNLVSVAGIG